MTVDGMTAIGVVRVIKTDKTSGDVIFDQTFKNKITSYARTAAASLWAGVSTQIPTAIAIGTGSPPAGQSSTSANDTALYTELAGTRKTTDYATVFLQYYTQYSVTYLQTEAIATLNADNPTGTISLTEAGLFDASGNLWSHVILSGVTHDNTSTLSIQWQVLQNGN